mgnify:CR=1 FL=1
MKDDGLVQPKRWAAFKAQAKKFMPNRAARWGLIYLPVFTAATLFMLKAFGAVDDLIAYALELAPKSMHVMAAIVMTYVVSTGLGWNLDNEYRAKLQRILEQSPLDRHGDPVGRGAFLILAGEMLSILALLALFIAALIVWQG